jgi:hypothetical protein
MFHVNPSDPSLSYTIRYIGLPENAVPYRPRRARRTHRIVATAVGAVLLTAGLAASVAASRPGMANDAGSPGPLAGAAREGVQGEFRLGPGNGQPVGYVGGPVTDHVSGEFRLGPGNQEPPGYVIVDPIVTAGDGVPGEFRLGPGHQEPPGYVQAR